jgi:phage-related protein
MRIAETVVEGVDGSRIEELGYATYDKSMLIGITPQADINEVIKFFSGKGDVVFSNEPDKYYKAHIVNQIDYTRLVRFRTATVTFRVQPFKFEYLEEEMVQLVQEKSGTSVDISGSKILSISVIGESTQKGTPTPNAPIEIENVGSKGTIEIKQNEESIVIKLDEPLRSSPSGAKDVLKIEGDRMSIQKRVGRIVFDGREVWGNNTATINGEIYNQFFTALKPSEYAYNRVGLSNRFVASVNVGDYGRGNVFYINTNDEVVVFVHPVVKGVPISTVDKWKSWLMDNNTEIIYELRNPKVTETAYMYDEFEMLDGTVTVSNSENANMTVRYLDGAVVVNNEGNYPSKPIIEIEGKGTVNVAINGNTLFSYTFPNGENTVVIDSQKQDAYLGAVLKNRNMVGEFPMLEVGENTITCEGSVSSIKISSKSRWM